LFARSGPPTDRPFAPDSSPHLAKELATPSQSADTSRCGSWAWPGRNSCSGSNRCLNAS